MKKIIYIVLVLSVNIRANSQIVKVLLPTLEEALKLDKPIFSLNLKGKGYKEIPKKLSLLNFQNIVDLYFENNQISDIPSFIFKFKKLSLLDLSNNNFTELPKSIIESNKSLYINFANNKISKIPKFIAKIKNIRGLDFSGNKFKEIPKNLSKCKVRMLSIENSNLKVLDLRGFKFLERIYVANNQIEKILLDEDVCKTLKSIDLSKNNLKTIPIELGKCTHLTELILSDNQIEKIMLDENPCKTLNYIDLKNNNLKSFPIELAKCTHLKELYLNNNQIKTLDLEVFSKHKEVLEIDLSHNKISQIKEVKSLLSHLLLYLENNNISSIPESFFKSKIDFNSLKGNNLTDEQIKIINEKLK